MTTYKTHSDLSLAERLKDGDQDAFFEIYNRYNLVLLNHAHLKLRNREESRDVVQDVFAMLWTKRADMELKANLAGYLYTAVRNSILNRFARQQVQDKYHRSMHTFAPLYHDTTDHLVREKDLKAAIEREIQAMPSRMKAVFEMSRKEHLSHQEIAERLHISERTVSSHITHALKILKAKFGVYALIMSGLL